MKKKVFISFLLISLIILGISTVYADVVFGDFKPYSSDKKIEEFNNRIQPQLKEIALILIILFIVVGLVLITFKFIKSDKDNKLKIVLEKAYLLISFELSLIFIYFSKVVNVFIIEFMTGTLKDKMIDEAKNKMVVFSIIYIITFIILSILSIKKKNKKFIFIPSTIFVIAIISICFIKFDNARIGVYVVDDSWFEGITSNVFDTTKEEESNKIEDIILEGDYAIENSDFGYRFYKDGRVEAIGNVEITEGTYYTIGENKIELKFTKRTIDEPEWDEPIVENINEIDKATIKDDNTILIEGDANGEKYEYEIVKYINNDENNTGNSEIDDNINIDNNDSKTFNIDLSSFKASENEFKDVNYGDYSFTFYSNGEVSIYLGFGTCGYGKYTIKNDLMYCELTRWLGQSGGYIEYETEPVKINLIRKNEKCLELKDAEGNVTVTKIIESNFKNGCAIELGKKIDFFELDEAFVNNAKFILQE